MLLLSTIRYIFWQRIQFYSSVFFGDLCAFWEILRGLELKTMQISSHVTTFQFTSLFVFFSIIACDFIIITSLSSSSVSQKLIMISSWESFTLTRWLWTTVNKIVVDANKILQSFSHNWYSISFLQNRVVVCFCCLGEPSIVFGSLWLEL